MSVIYILSMKKKTWGGSALALFRLKIETSEHLQRYIEKVRRNKFEFWLLIGNCR